MPQLPAMKPREVEKILLRNNFSLNRQTGSHRVYINGKNDAIVVVPFHSKDIPTGTLRSIVKQSKLPIGTFLK